jgi:hypothetical protein
VCDCVTVCACQYPVGSMHTGRPHSVPSVVYTEQYQAPGAVGVVTATSDLYAVGVSIAEMVAAADLHCGAKADDSEALRPSQSVSGSSLMPAGMSSAVEFDGHGDWRAQLDQLVVALKSSDEDKQLAGVKAFQAFVDSASLSALSIDSPYRHVSP